MKKLLLYFYFFIILLGIFLITPQIKHAEAAGCIIKPSNTTLYSIDNEEKFDISTPKNIYMTSGFEVSPTCFDVKDSVVTPNSKTPSVQIVITNPETNKSVSAKFPLTQLKHSFTITIGPDICKKTQELVVNEYPASWHCDNLFATITEISPAGVPLAPIEFTSIKDLIIYTGNKDAETKFSSTQTKIILDFAASIFRDPTKCTINSLKFIPSAALSKYIGDDLYTVGSDGLISKDQYHRITLNTSYCLGGSVSLEVGISIRNISVDLFEFDVPISNNIQTIDFNPGGVDLEKYCTKIGTDGDFTVYFCALDYEAQAANDFFDTQGTNYDFFNTLFDFYVKIPTKNPSRIIGGSSVIGSNIVNNGVNLGQFGSTGIKEGFSWDPCYDPKTQKQVTYLGVVDGGVDVSDIGKSTPLSDPKVTPATAECYTLLSNLPIKLASSDAVSKQIGYAPARGQNGAVIPGLVKTVIVGNFFIGDFILYLFRLLVGVIGLVAVAVLIYIGFAIATNKENPAQLKELKAWLGRVFGAIAIILGSYLILSIIDPKLTDFGFGVNTLSSYGFPEIKLSPAQGTITGGYVPPSSGITKTTPLSDQAYAIAKKAEAATGIPAAYTLAIFSQESSGGQNVGACNVPGKPSWREIMPSPTSNSWHKRDQEYYLAIMASLNRSPENQPLSCPLGSGFGGAMGPMQFIPAVWMEFKDRVASALGVGVPDPWNLEHALLATAFKLKGDGALSSLTDAACKYYSGKSCAEGDSAVRRYGADVADEAIRFQKLIDAKDKK